MLERQKVGIVKTNIKVTLLDEADRKTSITVPFGFVAEAKAEVSDRADLAGWQRPYSFVVS